MKLNLKDIPGYVFIGAFSFVALGFWGAYRIIQSSPSPQQATEMCPGPKLDLVCLGFAQPSDLGYKAKLFETGTGVKQDWAEAYYWYRLAGLSGDEFEEQHIKAAAQHLSPDQKMAVDKRVEQWQKDHPAPASKP